VAIEMMARLRRTSGMGEGERAASSVVLAVTAAVGAMLVLLGAVNGVWSPIVVPTAALLVCIARRAPVAGAWCALAAWVTLLPLASGIGPVAPLLMIVTCLALAIGPDRVTTWAETHIRLGPAAAETDPASAGWIEDDPRFG
jgi:hypothetical protein